MRDSQILLHRNLKIESETYGVESLAHKGHTVNDNSIVMLNRPPPYFPQNQLSPPDENRYKKFKFVVAGIILAALSVLIGLGVGIYYLIRWMF